MFVVLEYNSNESLMGTWNGKKSLLDWHYNCVPPIVHKHIMSNKVLKGGFEGKVAGIGVAKIASFISIM
jgi:hypothetical protein